MHKLFAFVVFATAVSVANAGFFFSKIFVNPPGQTDNGYETIEIQGPPNTALTGYWLLVIESDLAKPARGVLDQKIDLGSYSTGANGLLLIRDSDTVLHPAPDSDTNVVVHDFKPDLENGANTFVLGHGTIADVGTDLDADDDGEIDADQLTQFTSDDAVMYSVNGSSGVPYADNFGGENLIISRTFERSCLYRFLICDGNFAGKWAIGSLDGDAPGPYSWYEDSDFTWGFDGHNLSDVEPHFGAKNASELDAACGACCSSNGDCRQTTQDRCNDSGDDYRGDNTTCETDGCPYGACCLPDDGCQQLLQRDCEQNGGVYYGDESLCDERCPVGACCHDDGYCELTTEKGCEDPPFGRAIYRGDGTTCEETCDAGDTRGACCTHDREGFEYCNVHTESHCVEFGGKYAGDGTQCDDSDPCGLTVGNCCLPGLDCAQGLKEKDCETQGGYWSEDDNHTGGGTNCFFGSPYYACGSDCTGIVRGDSDGSGTVDFGDIDCFVAALISYTDWRGCGTDSGDGAFFCVNDIDKDSQVSFTDIDGFVECLLNNGCP